MSKREIISKATRGAFREWFVGISIAQINRLFDHADLEADEDYEPTSSGARRGRVDQFYRAIDFTDWAQVRRLLLVFEEVLTEVEASLKSCGDYYGENLKRDRAAMLRKLERDGFKWTGKRIEALSGNLSLPGLKAAAEEFGAPYIKRQVELMETNIEADPRTAIGIAKDLVETTCKTILNRRGHAYDEKSKITDLVKTTREVLQLTPESIKDDTKAAKTIKSILGNLGQIAQGIGELRNTFGSGHGHDGRATGLQPRHARLVVGAAATLAWFLFETDQEREATSG